MNEERIPDPRVVTFRMAGKDLQKVMELVRERRYLTQSDFYRHAVRMLFFIDEQMPELSQLINGVDERLKTIEETLKELNK